MPKVELPKLYKLDVDGRIREWGIYVEGNTIYTSHGLAGGQQITEIDTVSTGKNIGKKNATTPETQAQSEMKSRWDKQISKKGYVEDLKKALNGEHDFQGGEKVMLAEKYWDVDSRELTKHGKRLTFPVAMQPKLDVFRCNAKIENGKCTLWSRGHEKISGVPHIERALEALFPNQTVDLDGELYNHEYHDNFEELSTFISVNNKEPKPGHEIVQYHIYDIVHPTKTYEERWMWLTDNFCGRSGHPLVLVETIRVEGHTDIVAGFEKFLDEGYEGAIVRNLKGRYIGLRSGDLLKVKVRDDAEFKIVGVEEGRGKMKGLAIFVCERLDPTFGKLTFNAKMKGPMAALRKYFDAPQIWIGKDLTVMYQGFYKTTGKPRFPVAKTIREKCM